jgi:CubicO group peptidase (beta-lactamase class C family)
MVVASATFPLMWTFKQFRMIICGLVLGLLGAFVERGPVSAQTTTAAAPAGRSTAELTGLWRAIQRFGPDERGPLIIDRTSTGWTADFLGRLWRVEEKGGVLTFALPEGRGTFRAKLNRDGGLSGGQWFQPPSAIAPSYGNSIAFHAEGRNRWRGEVIPWEDRFTLHLMVERRSEGTTSAFIRNPERNAGFIEGIERLERDGNSIRLIGRPLGGGEPRAAASGTFDADSGVLRLNFPRWGGSYDFRPEGDDSDFWPRDRRPGRYVYHAPLARDDGWPVATLEEENIDRRGIEALIQMILDMPMDSANAPDVHGILIARHGKLVLEEYFHGFDRDRPHVTRSASKSITATLVGAAIQAGLPVRLNDRVYRVMNGGRFPEGLEPRKRAMTLENLLTMSSGIHCDDSDPNAPGNEERMVDQTEEPNYWRFYMALPMDRMPGERSIYCSGDPNLAIGVLTHATGEQAMDLFDRLLARPLGLSRHSWFVSPSLQPYGGGSVSLLPRDFLKFGQLMLNGGTWKGRRILSRQFVARASSQICPLNRIGYGYLWWTTDFPYKGRQVRAYWAGGNGGQGVLVVPELDLVIETLGGNYNSRSSTIEIQQGYPARYILPAVRERGDPRDAPVKPQEFKLVYGIERPAPLCPTLLSAPR